MTEATNKDKQLFGMKRLEETLLKYSDKNVQELLPLIKKDIDSFVGDAPQFDDITMICLEYKKKKMEKSIKEKIKKALFALSIIAAIFFTLEIIGRKPILPFPAKITFSNITSADIVNEKKSLITDKQGTELIFLNENKEVDKIINLDGADEISRAHDIVRDDMYFYVLGDKFFRNSAHIDCEKVVRYTLDGKNPIVIYESKKDKKNYVRNVEDIRIASDTLFIIKIENIEDNENANVKVYKINLKEDTYKTDEILSKKTPYAYDAKYLPEDNSLYVTDYYGHLSCIKNDDTKYLDFAKRKMAYPFLPIDKDTCVFLDFSSEKIYKNKEVFLENVISTYFNLSDGKLIYDNQNNQTINIYDFSKKENIKYEYMNFSKTFLILTILRTISVIYLVFLVINLLFNAILNKYKEKDYAFLRKFGLISVAAIAIIFVSIFYKTKHIESTINLVRNNAKIMASFFAETIEDEDFYDIDISKKDTFLEEKVEEKKRYNDYYGLWANFNNEYNNYAYITLYKKNNEKNVLLYDSTRLSPYNVEIREQDKINHQHNFGDVQIFSFAGTKSYLIKEDIKNKEGEIVGFFEIGLDYNVFNKQAITESFEMSMSLLTIFVAIYLLLIEGKALIKGFNDRRKNAKENKECKEIYMTHSLLFFQSLVKSFDTIILVLITKDMVNILNYPEEFKNYLITLPMLFVGIGSIVGPILYVFIAKRIDVRKSLISTSIVTVFAYVAITYAVHTNKFITFCLAMFVLSISNVLVYTGISVIPYRSEVEEERYVATHEKNIGKVSASIFGALIGGVVVEYFGNTALYIVNTVACLPIVILFFLILPKNTFYIKKEEKEKIATVTKNYFKYIFSIPMLAFVIFILAPVMIAGGYRTFIFPLFTQAMNMPKMYITNFYVFARVIMIILSDPIVKATKKIDYWNLTIYCVIAIGLSFMTFGINTTVVWAIIMLVINSILDKIALPTKAMLWPRHAEVYGLDVAETPSRKSINY